MIDEHDMTMEEVLFPTLDDGMNDFDLDVDYLDEEYYNQDNDQ